MSLFSLSSEYFWRRMSCPSFRPPRPCTSTRPSRKHSKIDLAGIASPTPLSGSMPVCRRSSALRQLASPSSLPPVISGHNNYFLWGPGTCTGQVFITVGFSPSDFQHSYAHITLAAVQRCAYCVDFEKDVPIVVLSDPRVSNIIKQWPSVKHYD